RARPGSLRSAWCRASCLSRTAPTTAVVRETAAPEVRTAVVSFIGQRSFRRAESWLAGRLVENLGVACSRGPREDDGRGFIGGAVWRVAAAHYLESDGKRRQTHGRPARVDGRRRAQRAQLDPVGAQQELGAVLLVAPAGDEGAVVQVRPVLDERVAGLDRTPEQGGGGALEGGIVVAVQGDAPGGAGPARADETMAGPVVVGQDAAQDLGVGVVGMTALAELDGVELIAYSFRPVRG